MNPWRLLWLLVLMAPSATVQARPPIVDLGATRAQTHARLGVALRAWSVPMCPNHLLEMRRSGHRWLKLVFGADERLLAASIFQLAPPAPGKPIAALRWPGLLPGAPARAAYPDPAAWSPWLWSMGAKQWFWLERAEAAHATDRERYLGGVMVNEASGFAAGRDFPYDVADAVVAVPLSGNELQQAEFARPLLMWRRHTRPNAYIEVLKAPLTDANCDPAWLARLDYTDILGRP